MPVTQAELDELWDFDDAAASEARLRAAADAEPDALRRAELTTQVARALGLQDRFDEGHALLDGVGTGDTDGAVPGSLRGAATVAARVALERGRLRNSAGDPAAALALFETALRLGKEAGETFVQVDALHMLAIADPERAVRWTGDALAVLATTDDPRTRRWAVSLHNNLGWSLFDAGDLDGALAAMEAALAEASQVGTPQQARWAHEAVEEVRAAIEVRDAG
jgi:tetratricopeptide (TPR) repeat protein